MVKQLTNFVIRCGESGVSRRVSWKGWDLGIDSICLNVCITKCLIWRYRKKFELGNLNLEHNWVKEANWPSMNKSAKVTMPFFFPR